MLKSLMFLLMSIILVAQASNLELKQVIVHTRHGARAPMYDVLSDYPWWVENYAPEELTTTGSRQHYLLGNKLRKQYQELLSQFLDETLVDVYSTSSPRAVRSAQSLMLGLYPESSKAQQTELINLELSLPPGYFDQELIDMIKNLGDSSLPHNHQTFPQTAPFGYTDKLLSPEDVCDSIDRLRKNSFQDQKYKQFEDELWDSGFYERFVQVFEQDLIRQQINPSVLKQHSELNMTVVGWFYDSLVCNQFANRDLPIALESRLMREIIFVYDVQNLWKNFPSTEVIKLSSSQLARTTLEIMDKQIQHKSAKKFVLFSGHDGDVNSMLQFLGVQSPTFDFAQHEQTDQPISHTNVPFASSIIFELYQEVNSQSYFVQTIFNGKVQSLNFCKDQTMCSFQDFERYMLDNSYNQDQWIKECNKI